MDFLTKLVDLWFKLCAIAVMVTAIRLALHLMQQGTP